MFTLVAIPLILFGLGWMAWHYRAYKAVSGRGSKAERGFEARRFLRRMQASAMIAVAGGLLFVGQIIEPDERPAVYLVYWCGVAVDGLDIGAGRGGRNRQRPTRAGIASRVPSRAGEAGGRDRSASP